MLNKFTAIFLIVACVFAGLWWWRKNYVTSPLEDHYAELDDLNAIGALAQYSALSGAYPMATVGSGWATSVIVDPTNSNSAYSPAQPVYNFSFTSGS